MRIKNEIIPIVSLLNFIPSTIYVIGDWLGAGLQSPWFSYIVTYKGESLISIYTNLWYVAFGVLSQKTAISIVLWEAGTVLLAIATCLLFYEQVNGTPTHRRPGLLILLAGLAEVASLVQQYGPLLHGPAGIAIPIGLPLVFAVGWWMYRYEAVDASPIDEGGEGTGESEPEPAPGG